jgi:hypothetical protein
MPTKYSAMDDCNGRLPRAYQATDRRPSQQSRRKGEARCRQHLIREGPRAWHAQTDSAVPVQQSPVALRGAVPSEWKRLAQWSAYSHTMGAPCVRECCQRKGACGPDSRPAVLEIPSSHPPLDTAYAVRLMTPTGWLGPAGSPSAGSQLPLRPPGLKESQPPGWLNTGERSRAGCVSS